MSLSKIDSIVSKYQMIQSNWIERWEHTSVTGKSAAVNIMNIMPILNTRIPAWRSLMSIPKTGSIETLQTKKNSCNVIMKKLIERTKKIWIENVELNSSDSWQSWLNIALAVNNFSDSFGVSRKLRQRYIYETNQLQTETWRLTFYSICPISARWHRLHYLYHSQRCFRSALLSFGNIT